MIRRDYILRMIEEFCRALARIREQKERGDGSGAAASLEEEARRLTGCDLSLLRSLSETELFARLLQTGEFQAQREKTFMLARVFVEAAEQEEAQGRGEDARAFRLKGLHLMLHTILRGEVYEWPEFVPSIELLLGSLRDGALPMQTEGLLMQHYERTGQFAKAEDSFFALFEAAPENVELQQLAVSFYRRLLAQSDAALEAGGLPRDEVEAGLTEISAIQRSAAGTFFS